MIFLTVDSLVEHQLLVPYGLFLMGSIFEYTYNFYKSNQKGDTSL